MSIFPAYTPAEGTSQATQEPDSWLKNESFVPKPIPVQEISSSDEEAVVSVVESNVKAKRSKKEKKSKEKTKKKPDYSKFNYLNNPEVDFYEETSGIKQYLRVETLRKPGCPVYQQSTYKLFGHFQRHRESSKRYYMSHTIRKLTQKEKTDPLELSTEEEGFRKHLKSQPRDTLEWLKYLRFKDLGPPSYQKEKTRLEIAEKAMRFNPEVEELQRQYLSILPKVYPTDEVLEIIQGLLNKEPNNYQLWNALIYNKQSAMAQCIIPDVLQLYEKCMTTLFSVIKSDEILVKIFKNCAVFMRQSGLWEQFFTLIHLALSLNVSSNAFANPEKFYSQEHLQTLIDYEELVLKSGLPMNEIWLRIEKLRTAFNFLPCVGHAAVTNDPQRMVLNEDVCHYIFPLINQNYNFDLFIMILKMLKYPFSGTLFQNSSFFTQEIHEYDNIEDILTIFFAPKRDKILDEILFSIVKEMNVPPSYVNSNLAYEAYIEILFEILLSACKCFSTKQNLIIFRLYMKLERILIILEKLKSTEITKEYKKKVKSRIKKAIKNAGYQENLLVYNEFAWIEHEMDGFEASEAIFLATMQQNFIDSADFMTLVVSYVETLLAAGKTEKAIEILTESALGKIDFQDTEIANTKKLLALQKQGDLLGTLLETEMKTDVFEIEDYFSQSRFLLVLKARTYYLNWVKTTVDAVQQLRLVVTSFPEANQKHTFIREQCYEFAACLHQFGAKVNAFIQEGLDEFPHNLYLLRVLSTSFSTPWLQIREPLSKNLTTNSVIFLIAACKYRSFRYEDAEEAYKTRVINILRDATSQRSAIRQNALIWRFYLRALFDVNSNQTLVRCKNTLYEALDVCPWSKALYMDGAFFAPQELSQLLDLIIEKQLRIHALPEELQILRE